MEEAQRPVCCQLNNTLTLDDFLLNIVVHIVSESLKVMNINVNSLEIFNLDFLPIVRSTLHNQNENILGVASSRFISSTVLTEYN